MAAQAALIADTIVGMKRALRKEQDSKFGLLRVLFGGGGEAGELLRTDWCASTTQLPDPTTPSLNRRIEGISSRQMQNMCVKARWDMSILGSFTSR